MAKEKLYFKSIDDVFCSSLENLLREAKYDGLTEVTLIEAIPDNDNVEFIWCLHYGDCVERFQCKRSECMYYATKSGRGTCMHRGKLYSHGNPVTFSVDANL